MKKTVLNEEGENIVSDKFEKKIIPYLFVAPALILFSLFSFFPIILGIIVSFERSSKTFGPSLFIGLTNYIYIFTNHFENNFLLSILRTFLYAALEVPSVYIASLGLAVLLTSPIIKGKAILRALFFLPSILSPVVIALVWNWLLNYDYGFLNNLLSKLGIKAFPFLLVPTYAFIFLILVATWSGIGFFMVMFIAGIQEIPMDLYESAMLDGATKFQQFIYITFPLLKHMSVLVLILASISCMNVFALPYVFTSGGPGEATTFAVQKIYNTAFVNSSLGLSSAMSIILALILIALSLVELKISKGGAEV